MLYLGDYPASGMIDFKWPTSGVDGASITRATDGSIRVYKNNSTTERSSSAGITDTEDFDSTTGVHHLRIDLSNNTDAGFYAAGNEYSVVLVGATIDGKTKNHPLAHFSIERSGGILALLKSIISGAGVNVTQWNGTTVATPDTAGYPKVTVKDGSGAGEINLTSGSIDTVLSVTSLGGNAISASSLAQSATDEIVSNIMDYVLEGDSPAVGSVAEFLITIEGVVDTEIATLVSRLGTPSNLGSGATVAANLVDIEGQTDDIGAAGAGLTSLPAVTVGAVNAAGVQDLFTVDSGETQNSAVDGSLVKETANRVWQSPAFGWSISTMGESFVTFFTITANSIGNKLGAWTGSGRNTILGAFQALFRSDADATVPSDVNADLGAGAGDAANTTESLEALRDRGDAAWTTATGFSTLTQADVRTAVGLTSANLDSQLGDIPTNAELTAALAGADDAVLAAIAALNNLSAAQVWDLANAIETGETPRQVLRLLRAVIAGVSAADDPEAGTVVFKRKDGTTTALTVVYNATADRTTVTVGDLS